MSSTSLDLSGSTDLAWVADLARPVLNAAKGAKIFVVGAMARELVLVHGHGIHPGRATRDVDFAVRVADWKQYQSIRNRLIDKARFQADPKVAHRIYTTAEEQIERVRGGYRDAERRRV